MRSVAVALVIGCGAGSQATVANVARPTGWEVDHNETLGSWTYEKYTPAGDGTNVASRFYVIPFPEDAPLDMDAYAARLATAGFQDLGYRYSEIAARTRLVDGWLIIGTNTPIPESEDDRPEPGFVMLRRIAGSTLLCKAGAMKSAALRDEAIEMCKRFDPRSR